MKLMFSISLLLYTGQHILEVWSVFTGYSGMALIPHRELQEDGQRLT